MAISNIWTSEKYMEKIDKILEDENVFEANRFFETHQYGDCLEQTEENTQDHDITIVDDLTFQVFLEHLDCYFH